MRIRWWLPALLLAAGGPAAVADAVAPRIDLLQIELARRVGSAVVALTCRTDRGLNYYGTGTVISADGRVLTNVSVVPPAGKQIQVYFKTGQIHQATIVEYDVKTESVLLQIATRGRFPHIGLADSGKARVGQRVYTFGNPHEILRYDAQVAVAAGAISAIGQVTDNAEDTTQSTYQGPVLETDAAVNPGSDGGPIVDEAGNLLGVMSLAFQRERLLGTAVPVHLIVGRMRALQGMPLHPRPEPVLGAAGRVMERHGATTARGVVWLEIDRVPEKPFELPDPKTEQWKSLNVFEQSALRLRKLMERPPGYVTGIALDGGRYVLTSAYHLFHNLQGDPRAPRPLIKSIKVHAQGLAAPLLCRVLSRYEQYDLALLGVTGGRLPAALELGSARKLVEGRILGLLGRQRGSAQVTLTQGIVSGVGRKYNYVTAYQTSALVNYANLGGPLIDLDGQVVGLATFLNPEAGFGLNSGVGLFTGADTIREFLPQMKQGKSQKNPPLPFLGVRGWEERSIGGAAVASVNFGSAAHKAGVRPGDLIVSVDGSPIGEWPDLIRTIIGKRIGQKIVFQVRRGEQLLRLRATLGRREWE